MAKKKKPEKPKITKEGFIKALTCLNREEITEFIMDKGKEPKMITPMIIVK